MGGVSSIKKRSLYLSVPLPAVAQGQCYQLIHVGRLARHPPDRYTITVYFQFWHGEKAFLASMATPIARQIDIRRAAHLVPGSLWDARGLYVAQHDLPPAEHRLFYAGAHPLRVARLKDLPGGACPSALHFWSTQGDTWVAILDHGDEQVLIPCFELLRAFYYHAGSRFTHYCFSQLPWELLCRPHLAPTASSGHQAQFYVATTYLTDPEARVLGGVLFDTLFLRTLNQAQAYWAMAAASRMESGLSRYAKTTGHTGRNVLFRAEGHRYFTAQQAYVWVTSLTPQTNPYPFRWLLYHALESNRFASREPAGFPQCSDLFRYKQAKGKARPEPVDIAVAFSTKIRVGPHAWTAHAAAAARAPLPPVIRGPAWAREASSAEQFVWFNGLITPQQPALAQASHLETGPYPAHFDDLIQAFATAGYPPLMRRHHNKA